MKNELRNFLLRQNTLTELRSPKKLLNQAQTLALENINILGTHRPKTFCCFLVPKRQPKETLMPMRKYERCENEMSVERQLTLARAEVGNEDARLWAEIENQESLGEKAQ